MHVIVPMNDVDVLEYLVAIRHLCLSLIHLPK